MIYTDWKEWKMPDPDHLRSFAHQVTPFIKWLHPDIVRGIAAYNDAKRDLWHPLLESVNVNPDYYLWKGSPCAFPGIRRHSSSDKIAYKAAKKGVGDPSAPMYRLAECLRTDDNDYPYKLWRGVIRDDYKNSGKSPKDKRYHLAHLFPHKGYELKQLYNATKKAGQEVFSAWPAGLTGKKEYGHVMAGQFTSAANFCFIPAELMRPTDHNGPFKRLLFQKAVKLYQNAACQLFPEGFVECVSAADPAHWDCDTFEWDTFTGDTRHLDSFNRQRDAELRQLVEIRGRALKAQPTVISL
jgi:hypothetical protein